MIMLYPQRMMEMDTLGRLCNTNRMPPKIMTDRRARAVSLPPSVIPSLKQIFLFAWSGDDWHPDIPYEFWAFALVGLKSPCYWDVTQQ
jgi:hypothetical protein